jgi:hydrogenase maturation protease
MKDSGKTRTLVIGVGNPDRGDDAIGMLVARRVKEARPSAVTVVESNRDGASLMDLWESAGTVIVIDAVACDEKPGTIFRFDAGAAPIPARTLSFSSHAISLAEGIELARVLNQLPKRLIVYGIVGRHFGLGAKPCPKVEAAVLHATRRVLQDVYDLH